MPLAGTKKTAIIVLDNGLNMFTYDPDGMHFQRAKRKLTELGALYEEKDDIYILKTVDVDEVEKSNISELSCRYLISDWPVVLKRCSEIIEETTNINEELFIISDFLFNYPLQDSLAMMFTELPIYFCTIGKQTIYNHGIDTLRIKNRLFEIDKPVSFEIVVTNRSSQRDDEIDVHLYIDEKRVAHQQVNLLPGISETVAMSYSPKKQKIYQGYVELSDDDLLVDNTYYFSFQLQPEIQVLFLSNTPSNFLETALESIAEQSNIVITNERITTWKRHNFDRYHVIFINNPGHLESGMIKKLDTFSSHRGSIIIMAGDQTNPDLFNRDLKNLFPHLQLEQQVETASTTHYFTFKSIQLEHPLFEGIYRMPDLSVSFPKFYKYFRTSLQDQVETLIAFTNEDPFLLRDNSNYLILSQIDERWTDLYYKGIFTPLLARLLQHAAVKASPIHIQTKPETPVIITLQPNQMQKRYAIHFPDGNVQNLIPETRNDLILLPVNPLIEPGNYPVYGNEGLATVVNINLNRKGLMPPYPEITNRENHKVIGENEDLHQGIISSYFGTELAVFALIFALLSLAAEHFIVKRIEGNGTT